MRCDIIKYKFLNRKDFFTMVKTLNLQGLWQCQLDAERQGKDKKLFLYDLEDTIMLPDLISHVKKENSEQEVIKDDYKFEGWAWFSRTFSVDSEFYGKPTFLTLGRTQTTTLWINGEEVGHCDSLVTPHKYNITDYLREGENRITVMVSNVDCVTSPNRNGITGEIKIVFYEPLHIESVAVYPNLEYKNDEYAELRIKVSNMSETEKEEVIYANGFMYEYGKPKRPLNFPISSKFHFSKGDNEVTVYYPITHGNLKLWSEYSPVLYRLELRIGDDIQEVSFGMRNFTADETEFLINGKPVFLRGKQDRLIFPLTGFAPTEVEEWIKIFSTAKSYGINHYHFHTCCPPDEAFTAGDLLGMYLQPEISFCGTLTDSDDENHTEAEQQYLIEEGRRIIKTYGNHPSFVMMSLGNELCGSQQKMSEILREYRQLDNRHLYMYTMCDAPLVCECFTNIGKLAVQSFKPELEALFRTKGLAGFQLPYIQDFENDKITTAEDWRKFCSDAVILAESEKYVYQSGEKFSANIMLRYYRPENISGKTIKWTLSENGKNIKKGKLTVPQAETGFIEAGKISFDMPEVREAKTLEVSMKVEDTDIENYYMFTVYPKIKYPLVTSKITRNGKTLYICKDLKEAEKHLAKKETVLFMPEKVKQSIKGFYYMDFWCYPMFRQISEDKNREIPVRTMELLIDNKNPALSMFPSESYATPQWYEIVSHADCAIMDSLPEDYFPIVQMTDSFERNHKLGIIFEAEVDGGKLLVCTSRLWEIQDEPEARQLAESLILYALSDTFNTQFCLDKGQLEMIF